MRKFCWNNWISRQFWQLLFIISYEKQKTIELKMSQENRCHISEFMSEVLVNYDKLRGNPVNVNAKEFWDAIIISACDASQENGYKLQIEQKYKRKELPLSVPFHIFADPPGYKIGCGGSTMYILSKISKIYGEAMNDMRFLLIPAGGYSQRLPNLTVLGKLFSPLPFGNNRYQMLDLILATYVPFLKRMHPGVFLASSDAIIGYSILDDDEWNFEKKGFTALAHPSPISVGISHGVYVMPENQNLSNGSAFMGKCLRVLQKPTLDEMHEKGAVVKNIKIPGVENQEIIFSDSAFYFSHSVSKVLIDLYKQHKPLKCELSSYGDFLQPLGSAASPSYIMAKVTSEELASVRTALYRALFGTKLSILALKNSSFHHLGTMKEYLETLSGNTKFSDEFRLSRLSFSTFTIRGVVPLYTHGTVINSVIHPLSIIPKSSVIEYCDFHISIEVGPNCILSNVQLTGFPVQRLPFIIPENTLIHTVPLNNGFVTIAFGINEDIKKSYERNKADNMKYFGKELRRFVKCDDSLFDGDCVSLWDAKLFPICSSPEDSFIKTVEFVLCLLESDPICSTFSMIRKGFEWISMKDILKCKDTNKMLSFQVKLCEKITLTMAGS